MGTASESGAKVFELSCYGRAAYLAQSPQFSAEMAIAAGVDLVFEIGPLFRAEPSFTSRHATESASRADLVRAGHRVRRAVPAARAGVGVAHLRSLVAGSADVPWISLPRGTQPVRRTPVSSRREPTHANEETPGQSPGGGGGGGAAGQDQLSGIPLQRLSGWNEHHVGGLANMQVTWGRLLRESTLWCFPCGVRAMVTLPRSVRATGAK
uniref:amino acid--tRNA ligase-related protein n=1 Tax=Streptomyces asoensis TaxID=249586 RepID=UPI003F5A9EB8